MVRSINRLTARFVATVTKPGRYADGGSLYLYVDRVGLKRWIFMFARAGKRREMGLGSASVIALKDVRELAVQARKAVLAGEDPITARRSSRAKKTGVTFGQVADELFAAMSPRWRNEKHRAQWKTTIEVEAEALRAIPVYAINTDDVLSIIKPIWDKKPETASRTRGRIERILDAARARDLRTGDNPARWKGHLELLLPKKRTLVRGHHAAMPFQEVPALMRELRGLDTVSARALEFTILTAARTGEATGAVWGEFDLDAGVWTVPAGRMKSGKEHRVPLAGRAGAILAAQRIARAKAKDYVFSVTAPDKEPSNMMMMALLRRMGHGDFTVHGFRSSFRDWVGEATNFPRELAEAALAHAVGDKVERSYRRQDALERRRKLMEAWDGFCAKPPIAGVVHLRARTGANGNESR